MPRAAYRQSGAEPGDRAAARAIAELQASDATEAVAADPTLAERQQRWLDVLAELLRRLARQAAAAIASSQRPPPRRRRPRQAGNRWRAVGHQ